MYCNITHFDGPPQLYDSPAKTDFTAADTPPGNQLQDDYLCDLWENPEENSMTPEVKMTGNLSGKRTNDGSDRGSSKKIPKKYIEFGQVEEQTHEVNDDPPSKDFRSIPGADTTSNTGQDSCSSSSSAVTTAPSRQPYVDSNGVIWLTMFD